MKKFAVAQLGARMNYAVALILNENECLTRLLTDLSSNKGFIGLALRVMPSAMRVNSVRRLSSRKPEGLDLDRIKAKTILGLIYAFQRGVRERRGSGALDIFLKHSRKFSTWCANNVPHDTEAVYGFNSASLELFRWAKQRNITTVLEQTIAPRRSEVAILSRAKADFPTWTPQSENRGYKVEAVVKEFCDREAEEWALADKIICGSTFVREELIKCGVVASKICVVPYGVSKQSHFPASATEEQNKTGRLKVLSVGVLGLRKGSPYLIDALKNLGEAVECKLVGPRECTDEVIQGLPSNTSYCGIVPRSEIQEYYRWADVFVLPSLCEGSATVTYEALSNGVPVVCTHNTGSMIENGVDGLLVPPFDSSALAAVLKDLSMSPLNLRDLKAGAKRNNDKCTRDSYAVRLMSVLAES